CVPEGHSGGRKIERLFAVLVGRGDRFREHSYEPTENQGHRYERGRDRGADWRQRHETRKESRRTIRRTAELPAEHICALADFAQRFCRFFRCRNFFCRCPRNRRSRGFLRRSGNELSLPITEFSELILLRSDLRRERIDRSSLTPVGRDIDY